MRSYSSEDLKKDLVIGKVAEKKNINHKTNYLEIISPLPSQEHLKDHQPMLPDPNLFK